MIRRLILVVLKHLLILAAGLVTAFFIFNQSTPFGFRQAPTAKAGRAETASSHGPKPLPVLSARTLERALLAW